MSHNYPLKTQKDIKKWLHEKNIFNFVIHDNLIVDVNSSVILQGESLSTLPFKFGKVNGDFNVCLNCLSSLIGSPDYVAGHFLCSNNQLITLEGAPKIVDGAFIAKENKLTSLDYFPSKVGYSITLSHNKLVNLKGLNHKKVNGSLDMSYNRLISLEGAPDLVSDECKFSNNYLSSLAFAPQEFKSLILDNNYLTNLVGCPQTIHESLYCQLNKLVSLKGSPQIIKENMIVSDNQLKSLEFAPEIIKGSLDCSGNPLITLKHAPKEVDKLYINYTQIAFYDNPNIVHTSIEHAYTEYHGQALKGLESYYDIYQNHNKETQYLLDLKVEQLLAHVEKDKFEQNVENTNQKSKSIKL